MLHLRSGDLSITIDEETGGRAVSWRVRDVEILTGDTTSPVAYGMYPMAPWAGRLTDDTVTFGGTAWRMPVSHEGRALHGIVLDAMMTTRELAQDRVTMECALSQPWPWPGIVRLGWQVRPDAVEATIEVHAQTEAFPAVVGWHPWFRRSLGCGRPLEWTYPDEVGWQLAERTEGHDLTGRLVSVDAADGPFDHAFHVPSRRVRIEWPGALSIDVTSTHDWFVVYDERPNAACVEPQTAPPNGVNESMLAPVTVVAPGSPLRLRTTWTVTPGPSLGGDTA